MWIVELSFTDAPERLAARPSHREKLTDLHEKGVVLMAGPLADDSGAVIIVDVPDRVVLDQLLAEDPYFSTKGVHIERLREWRPFIR